MNTIGINIKKRRTEKGYSLRKLAEKVNVSASFISQVEYGKISPSLAKLKDIANSLDTTVGLLIGEYASAHPSMIVREKDQKHSDQLGEKMDIFLLTSPDPNKQMEPLLIRMPQGNSPGKAQYKHFGQEFILVLKGKIEIALNETKYILNKGDSMYFNSSIPHSFRNIIKGESEAIWVVTPPSF